MARPMLTFEELDEILPPLRELIREKIEETEAEFPEARPLPPMTVNEALERIHRLLDIAATRPLSLSECFLHGQLLECYAHAIRAEILGHTGRYFVISADDIQEQLLSCKKEGSS